MDIGSMLAITRVLDSPCHAIRATHHNQLIVFWRGIVNPRSCCWLRLHRGLFANIIQLIHQIIDIVTTFEILQIIQVI